MTTSIRAHSPQNARGMLGFANLIQAPLLKFGCPNGSAMERAARVYSRPGDHTRLIRPKDKVIVNLHERTRC